MTRVEFECPFYCLMMGLETAGRVAISVYTDQTLHSAAADICLLLWLPGPNNLRGYDMVS